MSSDSLSNIDTPDNRNDIFVGSQSNHSLEQESLKIDGFDFKSYTDLFILQLKLILTECNHYESTSLESNGSSEFSDFTNKDIELLKNKLFHCLDNHLNELSILTKSYTAIQHKESANYFRSKISSFLQQAPFWQRVLDKPRGYAGDSEMMQMIYRNNYEGPTLFGQLLHKHGINRPAAQAVRNRRKLIPKILSETEENRRLQNNTSPTRVLSIACGPAWEMRDLIEEIGDHSRYEFYFLDQDIEALNEAKRGIDFIESQIAKSGSRVQTQFIQATVRKLLENHELVSQLGHFDFIYSMGLFDYLPDEVSLRLISRLSHMLAPQGQLVIGNYHIENPDIPYMEYWGDWKLIHRSEQQFLTIAQQALADETDIKSPPLQQTETMPQTFTEADSYIEPHHNQPSFFEPHITFEDTGTQMFLHIRRKV